LEKNDNIGERMYVGNGDEGQPGDLYRIRLQIAGKWRIVDWTKLASESSDENLLPTVTTGTYYIVGSFNEWSLQEMSIDSSVPGLFCANIQLRSQDCYFQIIRDQDWSQVFYPATHDGMTVLGPSSQDTAQSFFISAPLGASFRIQFQRTREANHDVCKVSWQRMDK